MITHAKNKKKRILSFPYIDENGKKKIQKRYQTHENKNPGLSFEEVIGSKKG